MRGPIEARFARGLLLLSLLAAPLAAQEAAEEPEGRGRAWLVASRAYQEGKFRFAASAYEDLLRERPDDPHLHYNLGNCRFRLGELGSAVASYWRAYRLDPRDPDIRFNLDFVLKRTGDRLVPNGVPPPLHRAYYLLNRAEIEALAWALLWLTCLSLAAELALGARAGFLWNQTLVFALALAAAAGWWAGRGFSGYQAPAVVGSGGAEARSGPGSNFAASFQLPEGHRVEILQEKEDWVEVGVFRKGVKGWVQRPALIKVQGHT